MLFPTHLAAAGLLSRLIGRSPLWLVVGAAVPDVVDKPLGTVGVTALFHSVGHSALLAVVMVPIALSGRRGLAVAIGWASHLALDAGHVVVNGRPADALFLCWPVVEPPDPWRFRPVRSSGTISAHRRSTSNCSSGGH
ncbi:metal-dependent hydrolase [Halovenus salina]|uniref:Metal-dependent hydrolase n=1 Tax=Halovenus salina TaxID=1510225 RepID=A0ABD5W014_9EURY